MGMIFQTHVKYNPYPNKKYSFHNWNVAQECVNTEELARHKRTINSLVQGNFHHFMIVLLDFIYVEDDIEYGEWKARRNL